MNLMMKRQVGACQAQGHGQFFQLVAINGVFIGQSATQKWFIQGRQIGRMARVAA